ncbi:hypothetical protein P154DRAFT_622081 [Amniculicola lignicola CBS 123094]|uniref:Membrane fusion mating protein FIG1 n=1 Tax=Amniculicola lignicola CBS 123094 TaxID=1392246 RepID=A0A6A5WAP9_9PLEO|nr:hypothetical protein P154DRAFT_622081 [Amniculicola lignicola CBS 123094]
MARSKSIRSVSAPPASDNPARRSRLNFTTYLKRLREWVGFHHVIMMIVVCAATVSAILVAGCGSSHIGPRVYLLKLSYLNSEEPPNTTPGFWGNITVSAFEAVRSTHLTVRLGYFGICAKDDRDSWVCRGNAAELTAIRRFEDPLGITLTANKLKDDVFFPGLLLGSTGLAIVVLVLFCFFPSWEEGRDFETGSDLGVMSFPNRRILKLCSASSGLATLFAFTSALWQHTSAAAASTVLEMTTGLVVKASVGTVGTALVWLGFVLWLVVFIFVMLIYLSLSLLDRLTDD